MPQTPKERKILRSSKGITAVSRRRGVRCLLVPCVALLPACGLLGAGPAVPEASRVQGSLNLLAEQPVQFPAPVVVMLEPIASVKLARLPRRVVRVTSSGELFDPSFVVADTGDTIVFVNGGRLKHDFFSPDIGMDVSFAVQPRSEYWSLNFLGAGKRIFFCSLHPDETFSIFVSSTPFRAVTDPQGRYVIPGVPVGTYQLTMWSEGAAGPVRMVQVNGRGAVVENIWLDPERLDR